MTRISLVLIAALLALGGVEARKDKLRVNQWNNPTCHGHVSSPQFELKAGECRPLMAHSVKVHAPAKGSHFHWFEDINTGEIKCTAHYYADPGCFNEVFPGSPHPKNASLPEQLEQCAKFPASLIRSFKFDCAGRVKTHTETLTITDTAWSTDATGAAAQTAVTWTTTKTVATTDSAQLLPRRAPSKYVWLLNPFSGAPTCYECWQKKGVKFQCEADETIADQRCGVNPSEAPVVKVNTATTTTTIIQLAQASRTHIPLAADHEKRRSPRKKVAIIHPFLLHKTCAKAKWKDNGKDKQKIIIKGPKSCPKDGASKAYPVDILRPTVHPSDAHTVTTTTTIFGSVKATVPA